MIKASKLPALLFVPLQKNLQNKKGLIIDQAFRTH